MRVLVTGSKGYIGSVLVPILLHRGYEVIGLDVDYFANCIIHSVEENYRHISKDIRDVNIFDVKNIDAIIHLAALSNDPLGELSPGLTEEINLRGTIKLAQIAKAEGVKRFIYASSQSMYGIADTDEELDEDKSEKNPVTSYAKTKWDAECGLKKQGDSSFTVVCFRPSTVFGASPRLRCDIVYNNMVACAYTTGKIEIKSDGTPWRPVVHIQDVCGAFIAGLEAPSNLISGRSYNVGILDGNFTVKQLAEAAQKSVPGCDLIFTGEHPDARTYKVSFNRILTELKDYYVPKWDLDLGGRELVDLFNRIGLTEELFRGVKCNRLNQLNYLKKNDYIDKMMRVV